MSETLRHVHFVAIGGTGMGALAGLVHARGIRVTGSDQKLYPPMSTQLLRWGIPVYEGFDAEHITRENPDLVVIGNAVRSDNPEARCAIDEGYRYLSFPDALYELAIAARHSVVIAGTHGKTTTTSLVAYLLFATGRDPSLLVGGISQDFDGSFREGAGEHFVVEGDEYDTAFFDKTPKLWHYRARTLVLTSVEFDHADIYRDLEHVKSAFRTAVERMPANGTIVAALERPNVRDVVLAARCRVVGYGAEGAPEALAYRAGAIRADAGGTQFEVLRDGKPAATARMSLFGLINVENALAALACVEGLGVPLPDACAALAGYRGVKRRQEIRGEAGGVTVIDDFAHHPTAVRVTIEATRARFPGKRLVAVFEPRSNTSRRRVFQEEYAAAFGGADLAVIAAPPAGPVYSNTGEVSELFDDQQLCADIRARGTAAAAPGGVDAIVDYLAVECRAGDVVLVMSNGAFGNIWERLLAALRARSEGRSRA
jgi:UDP-N-acetylmuramate: L-alanyl-gamma-D-glutamyl-meso-diaminopimelate ligase